jgi:hypothetical protein
VHLLSGVWPTIENIQHRLVRVLGSVGCIEWHRGADAHARPPVRSPSVLVREPIGREFLAIFNRPEAQTNLVVSLYKMSKVDGDLLNNYVVDIGANLAHYRVGPTRFPLQRGVVDPKFCLPPT